MKNTYVKRTGLLIKKTEDGAIIYDGLEGELLRLNEAAASIWDNIRAGMTIEDIIRIIAREFSVGPRTAANDAQGFIKRLRRLGLIENYSRDAAVSQMEDVYSRIPDYVCAGCARCCAHAVIYSLEFERIKDYLEDNFSPASRKALAAGFSLNMATQAKQREIMRGQNLMQMPSFEVCAFLDEAAKRCMIYSHRPFACRVFGLEDRRCPAQSPRPADDAQCPIDAGQVGRMRQELEELSCSYALAGGEGIFNKADISFWFYYQKELLAVGGGNG